jgi:polyhydroxyalkanoate synthesis regulator phasin
MQDKPSDVQDGSKEAGSRDDLKEAAHRVWLAGLGALAAAGEEGSRMFNRLVDRGRAYGATDAGSYWQGWDEELDQKVTAALGRLGLPNRDEMKILERRLEDLQANLERLELRNPGAASWEQDSKQTVASSSLPGTSIRPPK